MKKLLLSEKGAVLLLSTAVIVIMIATISTISLMGLVRFDNMKVQYVNDILQAETMLRSEQMRTNIIMQDNPGWFPNSDHKEEVKNGDRYTTYEIDNQPVFSNGRVRIGPTLVTVRRGRKYESSNDDMKKSPVRRYAESQLSGKSLAQYQYFTMYEASENDEYTGTDHVRFYGPDVLNGPVHSNDDIWIRQIGGGNNNGWPTFNALVTTHGRIMDYNTQAPAINSAPMDDIFTEGYIEESAYINISAGNAVEIRQNGFSLDSSMDRDVCYARIDGNSATCKYADIVTERDTFTVFNSFPDDQHMNFPVGDSIWTNYIDVKTLDWDDGTFNVTLNNSSVFVYCQLWIEGDVSGKMTWGCADTIFITKDLTYQSVAMGDPPDEGNCQDMLGLVSEERIYIQYKNYNPFEDVIQDDNTTDIYLYGCFAAIGDGDRNVYGDMNTHYEGIFSFYYQHPHGSTPGFPLPMPNGSTWYIDYPDFHKFIFPPSQYWTGNQGFQLHGNAPVANNGFFTCGYPYEVPTYGNPTVTPYGTDWPWYNPVWPEGVNGGMGERGQIHMFGGVQQFRRGFVHRSGIDELNHSNNTEWDIQHWQYDGTHGSTGYDKDYNWDDRIDYGMLPPDYPQVYEGMGSTDLFYSSTGWTMKVPPRN
ncbi:MAG: hypothetical protein K9M99_05105 [Candidatus Cloacimonetes bacterium]|nr:hypothetical protein [Candidatus Cloacimonadota bacterium]